MADIAQTLQLLVGGLKISTFAEGGEDYDVRARADYKYRADADGLALVTVPSSRYGSVPLKEVVSLANGTGPSVINRVNRQRFVGMNSNVAAGYGDSDVQNALEKIIADQHLPASYHALPQGRSKETGRAAANFILAFGLSFVFMYLVLAAQFESWLHPITILLCLPLTVPFALVSLLIFGQSLNIFTALGLLVLFGVVKKNSILQVDHTNHLRSTGMNRLDAILQANNDRLRPILMTTVAFVAGMIPLAVSRGIGAGQSRATGGVVIGGQSLSLLVDALGDAGGLLAVRRRLGLVRQAHRQKAPDRQGRRRDRLPRRGRRRCPARPAAGQRRRRFFSRARLTFAAFVAADFAGDEGSGCGNSALLRDSSSNPPTMSTTQASQYSLMST